MLAFLLGRVTHHAFDSDGVASLAGHYKKALPGP